MTRNVKAIGLALVAVIAMSAVYASGASAATKKFTSEASHTNIVGEQIGTDEFITNAGTVKCTEANYTGTQAGTEVETVTIVPAYSGCTAFGFAGTTINMNGCDYVFHSERETGGGTVGEKVDIECHGAGPIIITSKLFGTNKCTATVPEQTGLTTTHTNPHTSSSGLQFTTGLLAGNIHDLHLHVHLTGITYTTHAGTGFGACASEHASNGTYKGEATITGFNTSGARVGITYD